MLSGTGVSGASVREPRRAWKFLAAGAVSPFAGEPWPRPSGGEPGAWVAPVSDGVYACRIQDLPWWLDSELWEVELEGPVAEFPTQVRGRAGRLVARVAAWDEGALRAYGEACAWRARDFAMEALRMDERTDDAEALRRCETLADVEARARAAQGLGRAGNLAGFGADAARRAGLGDAALAAYITANASVLFADSPAAFETERAWQAEWIAHRLHFSVDVSA